jgi:hypothetical protein
MLTGKRAFTGKSQASLISAIMSSDPPLIAASHPLTPAAFDHVVQLCLAKNPDARWQCAGDVMHELRWITESRAALSVGPSPVAAGSRLIPVVAAGLAGLVAGNRCARVSPSRYSRTSPSHCPRAGVQRRLAANDCEEIGFAGRIGLVRMAVLNGDFELACQFWSTGHGAAKDRSSQSTAKWLGYRRRCQLSPRS